jgi:integrase
MRGHIIKRYKGSYTIVLNLGVDPSTGKRKQQWVSVKGTKKDAEKRLAELIHQIDAGTFVKPDKITVAEYLQRWFQDYVKPNLSPRTAEGYEYIIRYHIIPTLGKLPLTQLRPEHLQRYYSEKLVTVKANGKGYISGQSVRHHHMLLHKALATAIKWGLVGRNVADGVDIPTAQRTEMHTWDESEVACFLETSKDSPYHSLFYLDLFTGLRRSELLALRWSDIDFLYGQVSVSRGLHQLKDGSYVFREPKSAKSRRTIALPPTASLVLKEWRTRKEAEALLTGKPINDGDLVFSTVEGKPLRPDTISRAWQTAAGQAGIKVIRLHDARHTHASLMLKQGIHPKIVQERLGHSTIAVTLDTYSHVSPGLQEAAAQKFDDLVKLGHNNNTYESVR